MKELYRCDYCDKIGTIEELTEHEPICENNPKKRNCGTCDNAKFINLNQFECKIHPDRDVPEGKEYINCSDHVPRKPMKDIEDIFNMFLNK